MVNNNETTVTLVRQLRSVTKLLYGITDSVTTLLCVDAAALSPAELETQAKTAEPGQSADSSKAAQQDSPKPLTLEDVRAVLAGLSTNGHSEDVRKLLKKYGVTRLSEVKPEDYAALKAEAEAIPDGRK